MSVECPTAAISFSDSAHFAHTDLLRIATELWGKHALFTGGWRNNHKNALLTPNFWRNHFLPF